MVYVGLTDVENTGIVTCQYLSECRGHAGAVETAYVHEG